MHHAEQHWNPHLKNDMETLTKQLPWTMQIQIFRCSWKAFVTYPHLLSGWAVFVLLLHADA